MSTVDVRSDYVATRRIGEAAITVVSDGTLEWTPKMQAPEDAVRRAIPELADRGAVTLGLNVVHVALGDASLVIDPGCDDPGSSWQRRFMVRWPSLRRSPGFRAGLAGIGVGPDRVTHVLITHVHEDHFAGVTVEQDGRDVVRFPGARHLVGRRDWLDHPARQDPASALAIRLGAIERAGLLETVDAERVVAPGVTMLAAPGETPGHCVVRVRSAGESFFYVGDLFHHSCEVEHPDWVPANRDVAASRASRQRVYEEAASSGAIVVSSHERFPAWGRVIADAGGFRWQRAW